MGNRLLGSIVVAVIAAGAMSGVVARAQDRVAATALKTAWGEPDLQGIWTDAVETPLQRPAKYANQELPSWTECDRI
jgi:hypothetical protein